MGGPAVEAQGGGGERIEFGSSTVEADPVRMASNSLSDEENAAANHGSPAVRPYSVVSVHDQVKPQASVSVDPVDMDELYVKRESPAASSADLDAPDTAPTEREPAPSDADDAPAVAAASSSAPVPEADDDVKAETPPQATDQTLADKAATAGTEPEPRRQCCGMCAIM